MTSPLRARFGRHDSEAALHGFTEPTSLCTECPEAMRRSPYMSINFSTT